MRELDNRRTESPQGAEAIPEISLFEKVRLWAGPSVTALISIPVSLISLAALLFYIRHRFHPLDTLNLIASVSLLAICAIALWGSASGFYRIIRRKVTAGSFFPEGDELTEWRKSLRRSARWQSIVIPAAFCMIALGSTQSALTTAYYNPLGVWIIPSLMWLAAILIISAFALPSLSKWIDSALATVWFAAGVWYVISVLASHSRGIEYWAFPFVMFTMAGVLLFEILRRAKEKTA